MSLEFALVSGGLGLLWYLTYSGVNTNGETAIWFKGFFQLAAPWTTVFLLSLCVSIAENTAGVDVSILRNVSILLRWATTLATTFTSLWFIMFFRDSLDKLKDSAKAWRDR